MGVKLTGRVTTRAYAKREPHYCSSGPIILAKINSSSNDYARPFLGHSRASPKRPSHRRQQTILSYLKRWITDIWYNIMRRMKSMFSAQVDPDFPRSNSTKKVPSEMDSELENAFWREGIRRPDKTRGSLIPRTCLGRWDRRYCGLGDHADVYSLYKGQRDSKTLSSDDSDLEKYGNPEDYFSGLNKHRNSPRRIDSPVSFDEEYNALYDKNNHPRPSSGPGRSSAKEMEKCGNLVSDYVASATKPKKENCDDRVSPGRDDAERCPKRPSNLRTKTKSPQDGEWVQTVCFGSVWYSRSELDNPVSDRQAVKNRSRASSRIPRPCSQTKKSFPKNAD